MNWGWMRGVSLCVNFIISISYRGFRLFLWLKGFGGLVRSLRRIRCL